VSVLAFGIYMVLVGLALLAVANVLLSLLAYPTTTEIWIRTLGLAVVILGYYYIVAARFEIPPSSEPRSTGAPQFSCASRPSSFWGWPSRFWSSLA
jgi:protein-S-isoprenylcysteine O-methyltransferase Ste14